MASGLIPNSKPQTDSFLPELRKVAQSELRGSSRFLFFDDKDAILCSSFEVSNPAGELSQLKNAFQSTREEALRTGIILQNQRFEIHQFDPVLVYGRTMNGEPIKSEAIVLCKIARGPTGIPAYGIVTFVLPELTAKQASQLLGFCRAHLQQKPIS